MNPEPASTSPELPHRRRVRYAGKNPRRFEDKYKEHEPEKYPETIARVLASGKTPAGSHVPIMVAEILDVLRPQPGERAVDCTLGYGGHAREILSRLQPAGTLLGLDVDPIELPRTEARLRSLGYSSAQLLIHQGNFAGLPKALSRQGWTGADCVLADLGLSSMQIDTPGRGFSVKADGPFDMRMNPGKGRPASALLASISAEKLGGLLQENADEPHALLLAAKLAGRTVATTQEGRRLIGEALRDYPAEVQEAAVRRVFQALRIEVNDEFTALQMFLRHLPDCLNPGGRAAILTFHSGEDRRVKKALRSALAEGRFSAIAEEVQRPSAEECRRNPRASSAKLRWAVR